MARHNANVSFGFDAFDRAYEPEIMSMYDRGDISSLACSVDTAASDSWTAQGTTLASAYTYNDRGVSLCMDNDGVTFSKAINTFADSAVGVSNNFDNTTSKSARALSNSFWSI